MKGRRPGRAREGSYTACMEHECRTCNFWTANNRPSMSCPKCGETCASYFDEIPDDGWEDTWDEPVEPMNEDEVEEDE